MKTNIQLQYKPVFRNFYAHISESYCINLLSLK